MGEIVAELEYEVLFVFDSIDVLVLAYVDEGDFSEEETLEQVAIRRASQQVAEVFGAAAYEWDEVTTKHTGTLTGGKY
jgi:hypothetical protein